MQQCPRISRLLKPKYDQQLSEYHNKVDADEEKKRTADLKAIPKWPGNFSRSNIRGERS
jgi:hypothetical protein